MKNYGSPRVMVSTEIRSTNQISFIGLVRSKGDYKLPSGVVCEKGSVIVSF